jgi:L-ornithine Nalpha-acyltransferase
MPISDLAQRGSLRARLARTSNELRESQRLRYQVFYNEQRAQADTASAEAGIDQDKFDAVCDHLLVIDSNGASGAIPLDDGNLVGTYRLLRHEVAQQNFGFYSQSEFDTAALIARKPDLRFLELGRSCVHRDYRSRNVIELLWQGIWNYVRAHRLDVMFGCASFAGVDPASHAEALSFLAHHCAPPPEWHAGAQTARAVNMKMVESHQIKQRRALAKLPPLIKGYLRLGCFIGEGAVVDPQFNTVDVLIILPVSNINPRYFEHFGEPND